MATCPRLDNDDDSDEVNDDDDDVNNAPVQMAACPRSEQF